MLTSLISLATSVVVFFLGYRFVYRTQIRHLSNQITDREATLNAREATWSLEIAKVMDDWCARLLADPGTTPELWIGFPSSKRLNDRARLANDTELKDLLLKLKRTVEHQPRNPGSWTNVALQINRDPSLKERLGQVEFDKRHEMVLTPDQEAYLVQEREKWETTRDVWLQWSAQVPPLVTRLRERSEELIRATTISVSDEDVAAAQVRQNI